MSNLREKLLKLSSDIPSTWKEDAKYRRDNWEWLKKTHAIAVLILEVLASRKLTQAELANRMGVSPQQVNKIVQGHENLTLETISKIELALDIKIIDIKVNNTKPDTGNKKPAA
jgi:DNA-binding Xre family transcriptional regulator